VCLCLYLFQFETYLARVFIMTFVKKKKVYETKQTYKYKRVAEIHKTERVPCWPIPTQKNEINNINW